MIRAIYTKNRAQSSSTLCMRAGKTIAILCICAESPGPSLRGDVISTNVGSIALKRLCNCDIPWSIRASL